MKDWTPHLSDRTNVIRTNANLGRALAQCPPLEAGGWNFRVGECHVATGTYPKNFNVGWHSHPYYQLEIPISGIYRFSSADHKQIRLKTGQALLIPWKSIHRWECLSAGAMLGITLELLPTPESINQDGWFTKTIQKINRKKISNHIDALLNAVAKKTCTDLTDKIIASHMFLLIADILEDYFPEKKVSEWDRQNALELRGKEMVSRVIQRLEANLKTKANLHDISHDVGLSSRHLHRLFIKHVGKSMHDYLLEQRLDKARQMLAEKGKSMLIKEIAFECGFNSVAYFSNCYKKTYGVAPSAMLAKEVNFKSRGKSIMQTPPE